MRILFLHPIGSRRVRLDGLTLVDEFMRCYTKTISYTRINYFGGLESDTVTLYSNGVMGSEEYMYVALAVPHMDDVIEETFWTKSLSAGMLWLRFVENIVVFVAFFSMVIHQLRAMNWNIHRLESHIIQSAQKSRSRSSSNILISMLTLCRGKSEHDIDLRRHLYCGTLCLRMCLFLPLLIVWSWGISTCISVHPPGIGAVITLAGTAFLVLYFGIHNWMSSGWLMSWTSWICFGVAVASIMVFCIVVIFTDPPYRDGDESISFTSLTSTFLTLNFLPVISLVFMSDTGLRASYTRLQLAMCNKNTSMEEQKQEQNDGDVEASDETATQQRESSGDAAARLDNVYTLFQPFRVFSLTQSISSIYESTSHKNRLLYGLSVFFLLCYQMVRTVLLY